MKKLIQIIPFVLMSVFCKADNFPTSVSTDANLYTAVNNCYTTLSSSIDLSTGTISAAATSCFPSSGLFTIDNEVIYYAAKTASTFTGCTRGQDGTSAQPHSATRYIKQSIVAAHHNLLKDEIIAVEGYLKNGPVSFIGSISSSTYSTYSTTAGSAINIIGGTAGKIPYQSAANTTVFISTGAEGNILTSHGISSPTWEISGASPIGSVVMYSSSIAPSGWLVCNGNAVSRTTYAGLFAIISTTYGVGDNSTTFNLPDFRGVFPKGSGTTSRAAGKDANGNYYDSTLGTYYTDKLQGHRFFIGNSGWDAYNDYGQTSSGGLSSSSSLTELSKNSGNRLYAQTITDNGTNGTPRTGNTTEPQSVSINFIIKY
jgi:microcystin-dependent protein